MKVKMMHLFDEEQRRAISLARGGRGTNPATRIQCVQFVEAVLFAALADAKEDLVRRQANWVKAYFEASAEDIGKPVDES